MCVSVLLCVIILVNNKKSSENNMYCVLDINECVSKPCQHSGTCIDEVNRYTCNCVTGYTGVNCETSMSAFNPDLNIVMGRFL